MKSNRTSENCPSGIESNSTNPLAQGHCAVNRYRKITLGLAIVYFIWLAFLAWVAYKVLTA